MVALESCAHALFERQAAASPDNAAVEHAGQIVTYREVDERANRLAHELRRRGVGPDRLVGVCFERCIDLVVALLATWKAGGAYVPLDPAYPKDRLSFMVADSGARVLLTHEELRQQLFSDATADIVCLDSAWPAISRERATAPAATATGANLAYVMYTSGSTGRPKGAMIEHRGLVNYLAWATEAYGLRAGDSVPVHSSISFDLTVTSLFPPLLAGAAIELLPEDFAAQNLVDALRRRKGRGLIKITPAHLDLLAQQFRPEEAGDLARVFVIGGERLAAESLGFWRRFAPATRLINEYGPTETVVGCCVHEIRPGDPERGTVPIGRAISRMRMHVLGKDLVPAAPGAVGEIYIGGVGVGRGYLNRPELSAERFIADPFAAEPGAHVYRTGDLGQVRADGTHEYLGRIDDQVKIRGYRIEPGEIEQTLCGHPDVQACAVVTSARDSGDRQLVAWVVGRDARPTAAALLEYLVARLPAHMVPARLVFAEVLPLTPNGKVDRGKLAEAAQSVPGPSTAPARTPTEAALLAMWSELLGSESLGIDDDLFALGAHSLMAMRAVVRIREQLHADVPLRSLFEHPSVAGLARIVDQLSLAATLAPDAPGGRREGILL